MSNGTIGGINRSTKQWWGRQQPINSGFRLNRDLTPSSGEQLQQAIRQARREQGIEDPPPTLRENFTLQEFHGAFNIAAKDLGSRPITILTSAEVQRRYQQLLEADALTMVREPTDHSNVSFQGIPVVTSPIVKPNTIIVTKQPPLKGRLAQARKRLLEQRKRRLWHNQRR